MELGITGVDGNRQVQTVEEVQGLKLATVLVSLTNCNNKPQWNMKALTFLEKWFSWQPLISVTHCNAGSSCKDIRGRYAHKIY